LSARRLTLATVALVIVAALLMTSMGCATAVVRVEDRPAKVESPKSRAPYIAAYIILTALTIADVESTFRGLNRCTTCVEANPFMRPFVSRGRVPTYAVNAITMEIARRRRNDGNRGWYVGPLLGSAVHGGAAISNSTTVTLP
jgi:hypothetical protein